MQVLTTHYIDKEQSNTAFDLTKRVFCIRHNDPYGENDIVIDIDYKRFSEQDFQYIQMISEIIQSSGAVGDFKLGNLTVTIQHLETYEKDLIICK